MPECVLCNSQNFDVMDGLYFCTQCGTQSQDVREEVHDVEAEAIDTKLSVRKTKTRQKKVYDCGKPWFTLEGFQVLIKAQIEFLMKIGVTPALKDVVGQMWFSFVERSTNAFGTQMDLDFTKVTYSRDNIKDFIPTDSVHRKTPKRFSETHQPDDALELSSEIAREDFYEDDDPTGGLFEDSDEGENADARSHIGSVDQKNHKKSRSGHVQVMTLEHTLAFCFLGLLWLHEPICLSDVIRWAVEGHLPYFNATTCFPSHMKLSQADITMFSRMTVPIKYKISTLAGRLSRYISLPDIPRHQINIYIARYAIDLQVPACIYRHVNGVVKMIDVDQQSLDGVLNYDDLAVAYIIISLRLIYGLDDVTEHELENLATVIERDVDSYFPTWSDLIETIHTSQRLRIEHGVPWNKEDLRMLKDGRNYSKFCQEKVFGSWKPKCTVHRYKRAFKGIKGLNAEKQEEYAHMFDLFLKKDEKDVEDEMENVTSFPFLSARSGATKRQANDDDISTEESTNPNYKQTKGLHLDTISRYYKKQTNDVTTSKESCCTGTSRKQRHKNRYIRFNFPKCSKNYREELVRAKWWKDATLPSSLRQLVELCSKLIYCEPALLFNVVQMLEDVMFQESDE